MQMQKAQQKIPMEGVVGGQDPPVFHRLIRPVLSFMVVSSVDYTDIFLNI